MQKGIYGQSGYEISFFVFSSCEHNAEEVTDRGSGTVVLKCAIVFFWGGAKLRSSQNLAKLWSLETKKKVCC